MYFFFFFFFWFVFFKEMKEIFHMYKTNKEKQMRERKKWRNFTSFENCVWAGRIMQENSFLNGEGTNQNFHKIAGSFENVYENSVVFSNHRTLWKNSISKPRVHLKGLNRLPNEIPPHMISNQRWSQFE